MDKMIFNMSLTLILLLCIPVLLYPEKGGALFNSINNFITEQLGPAYLWLTLILLISLAWLAFGKYGNVKFGSVHSKPEFSTKSWIGMMFTAGVGSALMFWGTIEWAYYYTSPPFGIEPESSEAGSWAAMYGMFHWGFSAWAVYCVPALPIAYVLHVRKEPKLRLSNACRGVLGKHVDGLIGKVIDVFFMFGLIGAISTSLGIGTPMISQGLSEIAGIERTMLVDVIIIIIWTALFGGSAYLGLKKGIKRLSDLNINLIIVLGLFILIFGPTTFIFSTSTESVGLLLQNFFHMSMYTDSIGGSGFPQAWTIFYWAWWFAYAPFVGLFIAKISKGRTVKEVILGVVLGGTMGSWIAFALLGNTSMYFDLNNLVPVTEILNEQGAAAAIIATLLGLPIGKVIVGIFIITAFVFLATTLDSSSFVLASVATKNLESDEEPARWQRIFWAVILAAISLTFMYQGGLTTIQRITIITSPPLLIIVAIAVVSFVKMVQQDEDAHAHMRYEYKENSSVDARKKETRNIN
ncbi:BCCT family transporter [Halobacillus faecis]